MKLQYNSIKKVNEWKIIKNILFKVLDPLEVNIFELIFTNPEMHDLYLLDSETNIHLDDCLVNRLVNFVVFYYFTFLSNVHTTTASIFHCGQSNIKYKIVKTSRLSLSHVYAVAS